MQQVRVPANGGVDFAFEMAGSVRPLDSAVRMTRRGGTTVTAGLPPVDRLTSGTMALDDINHGFDLLHEGKVARQIMTF